MLVSSVQSRCLINIIHNSNIDIDTYFNVVRIILRKNGYTSESCHQHNIMHLIGKTKTAWHLSDLLTNYRSANKLQ